MDYNTLQKQQTSRTCHSVLTYLPFPSSLRLASPYALYTPPFPHLFLARTHLKSSPYRNAINASSTLRSNTFRKDSGTQSHPLRHLVSPVPVIDKGRSLLSPARHSLTEPRSSASAILADLHVSLSLLLSLALRAEKIAYFISRLSRLYPAAG